MSDPRKNYSYFNKEEIDLLSSIVDNYIADKNKTDTENRSLSKEDWIKITEIFNSKTKYVVRETDVLVRYFGNMGRRGIRPCPTKWMVNENNGTAIEEAKLELLKMQKESQERDLDHVHNIRKLELEDIIKNGIFNEAKWEKELKLLDLQIKRLS